MRNSILIAAAIVLTIGINAKAQSSNPRYLDRAISIISEASTDDWKTLCKQAQKCVIRKENLDQAKNWASTALSAERNTTTLETLGDVYRANGESRKAVEYYIEALRNTKSFHSNRYKNIQAKIYHLKDLI
ncbi:hypothetical protein [Aureibacter tunicatorum]|uniref:Lipopolysaccharide biosynthesis regulator YciM n=1 Tax=Aureibacter tunicatorum TaxID=866807 RepID=A0AAE3XLL4_9BACT|nr:hypothetical protein [Aureibacter tunicatorum]MDR6238848.1 lipopolysaccharide biosynthesis regulator YciM [Aureibacter tunicatorum]BDD05225.1 hypothetical protein AUTU_27080 [Aureibacter tunicatorum]